MIPIPSPERTNVMLMALEEGNQPPKYATELFWAFHRGLLDEEGFLKRVDVLREVGATDLDRWTTPGQRAMAKGLFQDPLSMASKIWSRICDVEDQYKETYEPDADEFVESLYTYAHIVFARALAKKRHEGYSEDTVFLVNEAFRTVSRLATTMKVDMESPWDFRDTALNPWQLCSLLGLTSIILLERFQLQRQDGQYADALSTLVIALKCVVDVTPAYNADGVRNRSSEDAPMDLVWEGFSTIKLFLPPTASGMRAKDSPPELKNLPSQHVVDLFEGMKSQRTNVPWSQVAKNITQLTWLWAELALPDDDIVLGSSGRGWIWNVYWNYASGVCETHVEPSELLDLMNQAEDRRAEERLKRYFFDQISWALLPDRARRALISADCTYHSGTTCRYESVLNDLRIAMDEILYTALWKPLRAWLKDGKSKSADALDFLNMANKLHDQGRHPSLLEFADLCRMSVLRDYLKDVGIPNSEIRFVSRDLWNAVHELRVRRNKADHEIGYEAQEAEVKSQIEQFFGIGCEGVLKRVMAIQMFLRIT